jgi:GLPGLI family protein
MILSKMKKILLVWLLLITCFYAGAQKLFSEGTITYSIKVETGSTEPRMADMFDGATATLYLKGSMSRYELVSALGTSVTLQNAKTGEGAILREYGQQKLLIRMNKANWADKNKRFDGISFEQTSETKTILGHTCTKAIAKLIDGTSFSVFYTKDIVPENKDYDPSFRGLGGLPMEYESQIGNLKVVYTISSLNYDPILSSKFEIPKTGYREMSYEESSRPKQQ